MHSIDLSKYSLRTDLIIEHKKNNNYHTTKEVIGNITVEKTINNQHKEHYTTISFDDVTDRDNFQKVEQVFTINLKKYLEDINLKEIDPVLIIGLGNEKSTPDSLGPKTVKQVLVTNYLFELGEVEPGYQKTSSFAPSVTSITGIETSRAIKSLISTTEAKLLIVIDALAASSINRLNKTIQITDTGIHPGSGVGNNRKELTKNTLGIPVIAIGVPTVVDATTIVADTFKYIIKHFSYKLNNINNHKLKLVPPDKQNYLNENSSLDDNIKKDLLGEIGNLNESDFKQLINEVLLPINYNLMVTPTEIDFIIEKLGLLIGNGINKSLHQKLNSTNN